MVPDPGNKPFGIREGGSNGEFKVTWDPIAKDGNRKKKKRSGPK